MINLSQNNYIHQEVIGFLEKNRILDFKYELLDNKERVITEVNAFGRVSFDSKSEIMGTASLEIQEEYLREHEKYYADMRIRPYFKVWSPRGWLSYPLGIFIMTSPKRITKNNTIYWNVDCFDKGIILMEDKLTDRLYLAAGSSYIGEVKKLLLSSGVDKYSLENSELTLNTDLEFEIGTSKLKVINDLLYAINYYPIHFNTKGYAESSRYIEPMQRETEYGYLTDDKSLIMPGATQSNDLYNVPNVVIRYIDNPDAEMLKSVYINSNPESVVSTIRRGRKIVDVDTVGDIANQDTLDSLTRRLAVEKNQIYDSVYFQTALMPMHGFKNCLFLKNSELGIETKYIECAWDMELRPGGVMNHELKRVVYI